MAKHPPVRIEALRSSLFHYRATVVAVHDGDTCTLDIDLGMSTWVRGEKVRLARIDAPELGGRTAARGRRARDLLRSIVLEKPVLLETIKDRREKYGRWLGELWLPQDGARALNVNDALVEAKVARYAHYG